MEQKDRADKPHHQKLFDELALQVVHGAVNQRGTVIGLNDFHAVRKARLEGIESCLDRTDRFRGVLAPAHDHHAANHLALAVQLHNTPAHLWPDAHVGDVSNDDRCALLIHAERDVGQVFGAAEVTAGPHHVLGFGHLHHRTTGFLVAIAYRHFHR